MNTDPTPRGKLKIFFGYAAGVGKTYGMLQEAHKAKSEGIDVVVGYVEPHTRPATMALLEGLEILPVKELQYKSITVKEFDIDAALVRKPELILVDELAHTNAQGSRHQKRYQDVEELLTAGIDVLTTVNVQHIESIHDIVESITGVIVRERIPDRIFNEAEFVELMDIEPEDLIERLNKGEVYKENQAKKALQNFFTLKNLDALREMSLRRTANRVNIISAKDRQKEDDSPYIAGEHILICLSSSPYNAKVIRTAARMAEAFHCPFTALFVETSAFNTMSQKDMDRLRDNIALARQLGGKLTTVFGDDIPLLVADYAKESYITKIVIGRPAQKIRWFFRKNYIDQLSDLAPDIEIFVIPNKVEDEPPKRPIKWQVPRLSLADTLKSLSLLTLATLIGYVFFHFGFDEANIITVYILGVLFTAVVTEGSFYSTLTSVLAVLAFNYFFTDPRYTLNTYHAGYPFTFVIMFLSAFLTSSLTKQARRQVRASSMKAYRTEVLLETSMKLQVAKTSEQIYEVMTKQVNKLLSKPVLLYTSKTDAPIASYPSTPDTDLFSPNERAVADWVYKNNKPAGATTQTLIDAKCLYLPIQSNDIVFAVVAIAMAENQAIDAFVRNLLNAMLAECALAIEKQITLERNQEITLQSNQERLRGNLLRAISHDLRTPLAGIMGTSQMMMDMTNGVLSVESAGLSAENRVLSDSDAPDSKETQPSTLNTINKLASDIYSEADWLHSLVENILNLTRLQEGKLLPDTKLEVVEEVIGFCVSNFTRRFPNCQLTTKMPEEVINIPMDAKLIAQVLINILENAVKHANANHIHIAVTKQKDHIHFTISDNGKGISLEDLPHIFKMFYIGKNKKPESRQGIGLGLPICETIIKAHNGTISARNRTDGSGAEFSFTLPTTL